jgi:hypothetical protein
MILNKKSNLAFLGKQGIANRAGDGQSPLGACHRHRSEHVGVVDVTPLAATVRHDRRAAEQGRSNAKSRRAGNRHHRSRLGQFAYALSDTSKLGARLSAVYSSLDFTRGACCEFKRTKAYTFH